MSVVITNLRRGVFVNTECLWLKGWQWELELVITRLVSISTEPPSGLGRM